MEGRSKYLIVRSPRMDGLKYITLNLSGVIILIIPTALELDQSSPMGQARQKPNQNQDTEVYQTDLNTLVEIIEKAGRRQEGINNKNLNKKKPGIPPISPFSRSKSH
ncbi:MAG: hypothetical protein HPY50_04990 [Firmicutes bacterium]|nr:hypothetical protein [Bacillota bacterium]